MSPNQDLSAVLTGNQFVIPSNRQIGASNIPENLADQRCAYLCGNSLGPLSKRSQSLLQEELQVWGTRAVEGHFSHPHGREWMNIADTITPLFAELVGAQEKEVACMGTLTANLHLLMASFYKPTSNRFKILCEAKAFPSDQYAFASQASLHGYDPKDAIVEISPRAGEFTLREADILDVIAKEGPSIALVIFSGVQYYTGQLFPMQKITNAAKEQGCICGWDLAHAIGNVPMALHDWNVDFAVWCTYKYLNSGPGGIGGLYIHEKWENVKSPEYAGWWGHDPATRFAMPPAFAAIPGAQGYQQSNPSVLATVSLLGSLQIFKECGMMYPLRERSTRLTAELEKLLVQSRFFVPITEVTAQGSASNAHRSPGFTIITPQDPESRGAQLSLLFLPTESNVMRSVFDKLSETGVVGDKREPNVIRLTPAPLYNTLEECQRAASCLEAAFESLKP
ncbi:pyridoxal phosphate-dependent transferase [Hygrophoropsis aurantiaca]|uniref:Pyridoxal phosphate-dependent transferase n=1 Tax=Hygrophoropsis aurantiaca TaxID=72124 RepID=A0ACB8ANN3_9AGAM|nr:pyridoxal phosphate-dependent transferase [Hygrophoropsis aurantiaca]